MVCAVVEQKVKNLLKGKKKDNKHGLFQLVLEFLRGPIVVVLFFRKIYIIFIVFLFFISNVSVTIVCTP